MRDRTGEVSWDSWDSILVENPGRVQPDRFGPPETLSTDTLNGRWHDIIILDIILTLSLRDPHLALILTSEHNYANTRPILSVQRPITFHSVSLERIRSVP